MKKSILLAIWMLAMCTMLHAKNQEDSTKLVMDQLKQYMKLMDSVNKAMDYKTGTIPLPAGIVKLNVPKGFKYLGLEQSTYIVQELWGNPPQEGLQGMIFPENSDPFDDSSYAYIVTYSPVGYVKDEDAKDINYDELMADMKKDDIEENKRRVAMGSSSLYTHGWAAKPFYDEQKKVLHWALDLRSDDTEEHTLNYKIISLGRKGMLTLNAIAGVKQLSMVKADVDKVINMAEYTAGNKYSDFDSKVDDVAAWTVGGLVAGKILAKTAAGVGILKFLKFIIIGIVAAGGAIWKWVTGRKKKEEEFVYEPVSAPTQEQSDNDSKPQ